MPQGSILNQPNSIFGMAYYLIQSLLSKLYPNEPKFSDKYAWANSADPDQTAPRGAV